MNLIVPTFQNGHSYYEYYKKKKEIQFKDNICIDLDFLHYNELETYLINIAIAEIKKDFRVRSKRNSKIKEVRKLLDRYMIAYSQISFGGDFYYVTIYRIE